MHHPKDRCKRQGLTNEDKTGRGLLIGYYEQSGWSVTVNTIGNLFSRRQSSDRHATLVLTDSHLDTQPTGAKFDDIYVFPANKKLFTQCQREMIINPDDLVFSAVIYIQNGRFTTGTNFFN